MTSEAQDAIAAANTVIGMFTSADAKDFVAYRRLLADRLEVDFGGVDGGGGVRTMTGDEQTLSAQTLLGPLHLTQHMISNVVAAVDGDTATVSFYEQALHHHPELGTDPLVNTWTVFGRGKHALRRQNERWVITKATLVSQHETGNSTLLADVADLAADPGT